MTDPSPSSGTARPSGPSPSAPVAPVTKSIALPPATATDPKVLLVGVAHVLDLESGLDRVLASFHPQALAVELDPERAEVLSERVRDRERAEEKGTERQPRRRGGGGEAPLLLRLWARMQDRFAADLGGVPGEEMLQVGAFAKKRSLPCFLVDDPIRQVAPRLLSSLSPRERVKLLASTVLALFIPSRVVEREIAEYSQHRDEYLGALRQQYPSLARVLLDERNVHMAERIAALARSYGRVAAVVGDAHVTGLSQVIAGSGLMVESVHLEALIGDGPSAAPSPPGPVGAPPSGGASTPSTAPSAPAPNAGRSPT